MAFTSKVREISVFYCEDNEVKLAEEILMDPIKVLTGTIIGRGDDSTILKLSKTALMYRVDGKLYNMDVKSLESKSYNIFIDNNINKEGTDKHNIHELVSSLLAKYRTPIAMKLSHMYEIRVLTDSQLLKDLVEIKGVTVEEISPTSTMSSQSSNKDIAHFDNLYRKKRSSEELTKPNTKILKVMNIPPNPKIYNIVVKDIKEVDNVVKLIGKHNALISDRDEDKIRIYALPDSEVLKDLSKTKGVIIEEHLEYKLC